MSEPRKSTSKRSRKELSSNQDTKLESPKKKPTNLFLIIKL